LALQVAIRVACFLFGGGAEEHLQGMGPTHIIAIHGYRHVTDTKKEALGIIFFCLGSFGEVDRTVCIGSGNEWPGMMQAGHPNVISPQY
jgi:hypothetical protein